MFEYIFVLYSCKKNIDIVNKTYEKINNKLNNVKIFITYGDNLDNSDYKIIDDKYIVLNVLDNYDNLNNKTLALINTINKLYPSIKGLFKCDDDIIININHINNMISYIDINNIDYCGYYIDNTKNRIQRQIQLDIEKNVEQPIRYECKYSGGPLYFLSRKSLNTFLNDNITKIYYEDMMIGYHLNKYKIYPDNFIKLYSSIIYDSNLVSYHNIIHNNNVYIVLQGGLGNQLFQLGTIIKIAEKFNKNFILNSNLIIPNYHQNNNISITLNKLISIMPNIKINNNELSKKDFHTYYENKNNCFIYDEHNLDNCFSIYNNVILHGYFINYKYISRDFYKLFNIVPNNKNLLKMDFNNLYFIHIRLGDFLKHKLYFIDLIKYYNFCINSILNKNKDARFIICTNQYDDIFKKYLISFPKNAKYIIQDKTNNDIDTLYIMKSCIGGICANSTLSFMGVILQNNSNNKTKENIYMPYPFVNFIDGYNLSNVTTEMYPEWCTVYNTIHNYVLQ